jgi:hypothetical protein
MRRRVGNASLLNAMVDGVVRFEQHLAMRPKPVRARLGTITKDGK